MAPACARACSGTPCRSSLTPETLASAGFVTGGSARNWKGYGNLVDLTTHGAVEQAILTDPQTSGGLLVACAPESVNEVLECFRRDGFQRAAVIGEIEAGPPGVSVLYRRRGRART